MTCTCGKAMTPVGFYSGDLEKWFPDAEFASESGPLKWFKRFTCTCGETAEVEIKHVTYTDVSG